MSIFPFFLLNQWKTVICSGYYVLLICNYITNTIAWKICETMCAFLSVSKRGRGVFTFFLHNEKGLWSSLKCTWIIFFSCYSMHYAANTYNNNDPWRIMWFPSRLSPCRQQKKIRKQRFSLDSSNLTCYVMIVAYISLNIILYISVFVIFRTVTDIIYQFLSCPFPSPLSLSQSPKKKRLKKKTILTFFH